MDFLRNKPRLFSFIVAIITAITVVFLYDLLFSVSGKDYKNYFAEIIKANKADSSKIAEDLSKKMNSSEYYSMLYGFCGVESLSNVPKFTKTRIVYLQGTVSDSTVTYVPPENWRKWKDFIAETDKAGNTIHKSVPIKLMSTNVCRINADGKPVSYVQAFMPDESLLEVGVEKKEIAKPIEKKEAKPAAGKRTLW